MNKDAKELLLKLKEENRDFRLAFSVKATKNDISTDRVVIIFHNKTFDEINYIIKLITDNKKIEEWVKSIFIPGKTVFISFTGNTRKIYLEKLKGVKTNDKYFNRSIEWNIGDEDNFHERNYSFGPKDKNDFLELIPPELIPYLNFNHCLTRTDGQIYIRHKKINNNMIKLNRYIGRPIIKMLAHLQRDTNLEIRDMNIKKLITWLKIHESRKAVFNWIQVTDNSMTLYIG